MSDPAFAHPADGQDEETLFDEARRISDPRERADFLREACGSDARLLRAVEGLLADHERASALFLRSRAALGMPVNFAQASMEAPDPEIGTQIGPYGLVRRLGEGGGGVVYEAAQESPVRRAVALKILKLGMDTRRVIARFEAERQALALMEHPNIARVLDAGATETGRPYFVMELVHGTRITDYCERNDVPLPGRLRLFQQVCAAVQHAHQKGIIHRDLKPSNILVTEVDGMPVPKVIDFGIAKAVAAPLGRGTLLTLNDQPVGTPACMSPEQFLGGDVDTRSDIYSLGVVLYELLAGCPPFDNDELLDAGFDEMRRRVQHDEPPRPSARAPHGAAQLRGELDWIVMKALEKDRERRYQTVRGLSEDIDRHLADEPVSARPPSRLYRLRKLVRRNRLASAAIVAAVLFLAAGFTTSTLLFLRAQAAERQQARLRAEAEEREHVTRAAILIMQDRMREADAEIRSMGGTLTQPSLEATNVFRELAVWNALRGDWPAAAQRLLALSRVNRFDDTDKSDNATRDLVPLAPTLIEASNLEAYHDFCQLLLDRLGRTRNPVAAEHVLKSCLQLPPDPATLERLVPVALVAEESLSSATFAISDRLDAWRCNVLALWNYRRGDDARAILWATRALTLEDDERARQAYGLAVRALSLTRLGRANEARSDIERARGLVEANFSRPLEFNEGGYWHDWIATRLLLAEAIGSLSPSKD